MGDVRYKVGRMRDDTGKTAAYQAQYYKDHKEKKAAYDVIYRAANKEKMAQYREDNKAKKAGYNARYRKANKEKLNIKMNLADFLKSSDSFSVMQSSSSCDNLIPITNLSACIWKLLTSAGSMKNSK